MGEKQYTFQLADVQTFPDDEAKDDKTTFTIPRSVYDEMLRAKVTLEVIGIITHMGKDYQVTDFLKYIFGKEDAN